MKIIVPCAGKSSRFPNMPPKWLLPDYEGVAMVYRSVERLDVKPSDLIFIIRREHEEMFNASFGLKSFFNDECNVLVLERETSSQSETVVEAIKHYAIDEPFMVKDSDNCFSVDLNDCSYSFLSVASLNDFTSVNPHNKSYVKVDHDGFLMGIKEKKIISDLFSVGGYFFNDPKGFLKSYEILTTSGLQDNPKEIYISEIINHMYQLGHFFKIKMAQNYQDWGTVDEWKAELRKRTLFMVSVDGFLFKRNIGFNSSSFLDVQANQPATEFARKMEKKGNKIIYCSIRSANQEKSLVQRLKLEGLNPFYVIMECPISNWTIVTSPEASVPIRSSDSLEIDPLDINLEEKIID